MKYVYVLTSNETDFYAEQAVVSIYSLKKFNSGCFVVLVVDSSTNENLINGRELVKNLVDEVIVIDIPQFFSNHQKSRFLKTSLRDIISGDFIFIDTDTIILGSLDELESMECEMGVVRTMDSEEWSRENPHRHFKKYNLSRGLRENYNYGIDYFYNSGFILCRDTKKTRELYKIWHKLWKESAEKYNWNQDQCDLDLANAKMGNLIINLDGIYNFEALYPNVSMKYFDKCKIFHYFASSFKTDYLNVKKTDFLFNIRKNGITDLLDSTIQNVKNDYITGLTLKSINIKPKPQNPFLVDMVWRFYKKYPRINKFLEGLCR